MLLLSSLAPFVNALAPRRCAGCQAVTEVAVCEMCCAELRAVRLPEQHNSRCGVVVGAFRFDPLVRRILHRGKYEGFSRAVDCLAALASERLVGSLRAVDMLVPLPLAHRRLRGRGFNQADIMANHCALVSNGSVSHDLVRVRETNPQVGRSRNERRANVQGAFAWRGQSLRGQRVALVDDVFTTGATALSAAGVLVAAGAEQIDVFVLAVADEGIHRSAIMESP